MTAKSHSPNCWLQKKSLSGQQTNFTLAHRPVLELPHVYTIQLCRQFIHGEAHHQSKKYTGVQKDPLSGRLHSYKLCLQSFCPSLPLFPGHTKLGVMQLCSISPWQTYADSTVIPVCPSLGQCSERPNTNMASAGSASYWQSPLRS